MKLTQYLEKITQAAFASEIGVSPGLIYQWVKGIRPISAEQCVVIERITNGAVTRKDLRPEDYFLIWPEIDDRHHPEKHAA